MNLKSIWVLVKDTSSEWLEDRAPRLGAALAYYTVFSLAPLLLIVVAIAGLAFGKEAVQGQVVEQIGGLVGGNSAEAIQAIIENAYKPASGVIATVIGIVVLLFGATGVFGELKDALNTVWDVPLRKGGGIIGMIKDRFLSFTMVLGVGFLLLVSLVISAGLAGFSNYLNYLLPGFSYILRVVNFIISFGLITVLFAMIYKVLPDMEIAWSDVWVGAAVTSLLFTVGKFLIGLYLGKSSVGSAYGAAGSFVIILVWVYYSALIFFFGAEFTQGYAKRYGSLSHRR